MNRIPKSICGLTPAECRAESADLAAVNATLRGFPSPAGARLNAETIAHEMAHVSTPLFLSQSAKAHYAVEIDKTERGLPKFNHNLTR